MRGRFSPFLAVAGLVVAAGCSQAQYSNAQLTGVWRHETTTAREGFGGTQTERLNLKLDADGKVELLMTVDKRETDKLEGTWKCAADYLVMTRADSSFGVFRIVAVDDAELRILTRAGALYRLTKMPK